MNILHKRTIALVSVLALVGAGVGCELIVNFDRSKIPNDAGIDAPLTDMGAPDAPSTDSPTDSPPPIDSPPGDSPSESASETGADGAMEAGTETGSDAAEAGDATVDGADGADASPDAPAG
jgi:hypothetical protein